MENNDELLRQIADLKSRVEKLEQKGNTAKNKSKQSLKSFIVRPSSDSEPPKRPPAFDENPRKYN